jgi:hypothetical protein
VIYACDGVTACTGSMSGVFEEEGEYEYASYIKDSEDGKQEAHVEPAILVQPLHEAGEGGTKRNGARPLVATLTSTCELSCR